MDVFLLGAGRPAAGTKPAALKFIAADTRAMDWQLQSFSSLPGDQKFTYLGGYEVGSVIRSYPNIGFTVIPDWANQSVLHTLLSAPFSRKPAVCAYSDTVFRPEVVLAACAIDADLVYGIDSHWKSRYERRDQKDIAAAETTWLNDQEVEFTGLLSLSPKAVTHLRTTTEQQIGTTLPDLVAHLDAAGFSVEAFDVEGKWAEFNAPGDIAQFVLGTKAETLARLRPLVTESLIGDQFSFTANEWAIDPQSVIRSIQVQFENQRLIIRSSSKGEDNWDASNAGGFESVLDVDGSNPESITDAINPVINSYGEAQSGNDQVLVQLFLPNVRMSGVILTCALESGAPYYRFNFDDQTQSTESVTSGEGESLRTVIINRSHPEKLATVEPTLVPVLNAVTELESLLGFDRLDIEFAVDTKNQVHIFQVRPITVDHSAYDFDPLEVKSRLSTAAERFVAQQNTPPQLNGTFTLFANMPDWNPAEIIGTHPRPLAFSLYRHLITNDIWALQRAQFGYLDVRPAPLIFNISGQPYVDARATFNSFIPAALPRQTQQAIAEAYLKILRDKPHLHDKIEFDIAFTVWTPQMQDEANSRLAPYGVSPQQVQELRDALQDITCKALVRLKADTEPVAKLSSLRSDVQSSSMALVDKIYAVVEDCKQQGTLAFSHAARAGFVATTLLNSLVAGGVLTTARRLAFMQSFHTVAGEFTSHRSDYRNGKMSLSELAEKYGHLRPGTYEITAAAYHEEPDHYLVGENTDSGAPLLGFEFSPEEEAGIATLLKSLGSTSTVNDLCNYLREAIQSREAVKFEFTRSLSFALDLLSELAQELGFTREDLSYLEYHDVERFKLGLVNADQLSQLMDQRRSDHAITRLIELPPVIAKPDDLYCFERFNSQPNYVTLSTAEGLVVEVTDDTSPEQIQNKIVMIPSADPGYDWLFGQNIKGLITKYGGANSHMAIRAAEAGLPAAIGVGDSIFESVSRMSSIQLDCANHLIREIR